MIILSGITFLMVVFFLLLANGVLNGFIVSQAVDQVNKALNAHVKVGELSGNPLAHITINDLSIEQNNREILKIDKVEIGYSLLRLLQKEILINTVRIGNVKVEIWQDHDSIWNIQKLYTATDTAKTDQSESGFSFVLNLEEVECTHLMARIQPLDTASVIPKTVDASLSLSFLMKGDGLELKLKNLAVKTTQPKLVVESMALDLRSDSNSYQWSKLQLHMPHTELISEGKYSPKQPFLSSGQIAVDTLAFDDISDFLPQFNMKGNPSVFVSANGEADKINLSVLVKEHLQKAEINGWVRNLNTTPEYNFVLDVSNLDGSFWTEKPEYATQITGKLQVKGVGYDAQKSKLTALGSFPELSFQDKTLRNLNFEAMKDTTFISGNLSAESWFGGLDAEFSIADFLSNFKYSVICSARNVDLAKLYLSQNLYSSLNFKVKADGVGMNPLKGSFRANIISSKSTITDRPIDDFHTQFSYTNGSYNVADFDLNSSFFKLEAEGKGNIYRNNYVRFNLETKDLDALLKLTGYGEYSLSGQIVGDLKGSAKSYSADATVKISKFSKDSLFVHDLNGSLNFTKDTDFYLNSTLKVAKLGIDTIVFQNLIGDLHTSLAEEISLGFKISADSVRINHKNLGAVKAETMLYTSDSLRLDAKLRLDSINYLPYRAGAVNLDFSAAGSKGDEKSSVVKVFHQLTDKFDYQPILNYFKALQKDTANLVGHADVQNFLYDTLSVGRIDADLVAVANIKNCKGNLSAKINQIKYSGIGIKEASLKTAFQNYNFKNSLNLIISDSITGKTDFDIDLRKDVEIGINNINVHYPLDTWSGGSDSTKITYANNLIKIRNFKIAASDTKYLEANGIYAIKGDEDFDFRIQGLQLENLSKLISDSIPVTGIVDASLLLSGTSVKPNLNANLKLSNVVAYGDSIELMDARLVYDGDSIDFNGNVKVADTLILESSIKAPFRLSLENPTFTISPTADVIKSKFKINRFDLSFLKPFLAPEQINILGHLNADVTANGTLANMDFQGFADWKEGKFQMPELGVMYDNIRMNVIVREDSIYIKEMKADAGAGTLKLTGFSILDSKNIYNPKVISLNLSGKDFKVVDSKELQATINTEITLKKDDGHPVFAGELEVIRSEANADAFIERYKRASDEADPPLLVKALEKKSVADGKKLPVSVVENKYSNLQIYKDLRGKFNVRIPRNMWIRGKDMGFEVKGDLQALKEGAHLVYFGTLEVKQGFYKFYGKRFDFKSGKITLTGDEDINPVLDFDVAYSFRNNEKVLKTLEMKVTGRLKDPQLAFEINGTKIEEQDALSYLLFGGSMEELSDGQKSTLDRSTSVIAIDFAFGQVSNVLKDAVQSSLKLDVVEIAGDDNWNAGSVTVGKYISKNLYMSYQYTFALDKNATINDPQKVSIEYQLFRFLALKATNQSSNSGIDVVFKREFK